MSLRFILGRARSGKTAFCLDSIRDALRLDPQGPPIILLVPEQATFQAERALVNTSDLPGFARAQVLSFKRLAARVLLELGGGARRQITELGKIMVLRSLVQDRAADLCLFARMSPRCGFASCLAQTLRELSLYKVDVRALEAAAEHLEQDGRGESALVSKLRDLATIARAYREYLGQEYQDPDDYLGLAAERVRRSSLVRDGTVWVDGFRGFTPQEYDVLAALLVAAKQVNVALCLDPADAGRAVRDTDLFHPTWDTYDRLTKLSQELRVEIEEPIALGGRPSGERREAFASPALSHLEREFASLRARPFDGEPEGLRLVAAANPRVEVEAVAREILALCRERGMRFRDIGVIVPSLESYHDLVQPIFRDYGIPCFIDRRRPVSHHPLVELVRSALEAVSENWGYGPVFRYLKTDLVPVSRDEVDVLENFVLAHGIRGSRWTDPAPWRYRRSLSLEEDTPPRPEDEAFLDAVNDARTRAAQALAAFGERVARDPDGLPVRELAGAVFELLQELGVRERLDEWRTEAMTAGELERAHEHEQVWNGVLGLLDEVVGALGDKRMRIGDFREVIEAGLEGLTLGLIPPAIDQTIVGSVERSRHPALRAAFVLGATYDALPRRMPEDTVFSDRDRGELVKLHVELAPDSRLEQLHEAFTVYTALTKGGEYLWISYPLADAEGRALRPSTVVARVRALFPKLREEFVSGEPPSGRDAILDAVVSEERVAAALVRHLRARGLEGLPGEDPSDLFWMQLYEWLTEDPGRREGARFVLGSLGFSNAAESLSSSTAHAFHGNVLRTSVSRLERFARCPFAHFARDMLGLAEREVYRLERPGMGTLVHAALRKLFEDVGDERLARMQRDELGRAVSNVVQGLAPKLKDEILLSNARHQHIVRALERILVNAAIALQDHSRRSEFRVARTEVRFGDPDGLPPWTLEVDDHKRVELVGRIDRVDVARGSERSYVRVVDYKSSPRKLHLSDVYNGIALQLLAYLAVASEFSREIAGTEAEPAGALYFPVIDPMITRAGPVPDDELEKERKRKVRMSGLIVGDADVVRLMDRDASGRSDLVPAGLTKSGEVARGPGTSVIGRDRYSSLHGLLAARLKEFAARILSGEVALRPYRRGTERACQICEFKPVCGFDVLLPGNQYRSVHDMKGDEFWQAVQEAALRTRRDV